MRARRFAVGLALGLVLALLAGCRDEPTAPEPAASARARPPPPPPALKLVGGAACTGCHDKETKLWTGSHHDRAMDRATPSAVVADFSKAVRSGPREPKAEVSMKDGHYRVETAGASGESESFQVAYTFGFDPLQQYLVPLPGGRYQATRLAWDARGAEEGGQRWFHLYAGESIPPGDELHWTGPNQNWQGLCAECHSTGLVRGYDPKQRSYDTQWTDIDVNCEACHGPGSEHVAWARKKHELHPRLALSHGFSRSLEGASRSQWLPDARGTARRAKASGSTNELATCARCHARRHLLRETSEVGSELLDFVRPELPLPPLYHPDGQVNDEVYVYGSFTQSKMHAAGVTCSDCHDPHSGQLAAPGNALCGQCHESQRFDTTEHHRHVAGASAPACVDCHMPAKIYMGVDSRRDHSLRVPRPDLAAQYGVPNACAACHERKTAEWAAGAAKQWWGEPKEHFGAVWAAAQRGDPNTFEALAKFAGDESMPVAARATSVALAARVSASQDGLSKLLEAVRGSSDSWVRLATVDAAAGLPPPERVRFLTPLLEDRAFAVRAEAMRDLVTQVSREERAALQSRLERVAAEYRSSQRPFLDRAGVRLSLGALDTGLGKDAEAEAHYREALRLDPAFAPAAVNLADLFRAQGKNEPAEALLHAYVDRMPDSADLQHAWGLALIRLGQRREALKPLARAAELAPDNARYAFAHGLALDATEGPAAAARALAGGLEHQPWDRSLLATRVQMLIKAKDTGAARTAARQWLVRHPEDPEARALAAQLEP